MSGLIIIRSFYHKHEAELVKEILSEQGIESIIQADDCGGMRPHLTLGTAGVQLLIKKEDFEKAKEILETIEKKEMKGVNMDNQLKNMSYDNVKSLLGVIIILLILILSLEVYNTYTSYKYETRWATKTYDETMTYMYKRDYNGLLKYCDAVLKRNPDDESALIGKAAALYYLGRDQEAKKLFIEVKKKAPYWATTIDGYINSIDSRLDEKNLKK